MTMLETIILVNSQPNVGKDDQPSVDGARSRAADSIGVGSAVFGVLLALTPNTTITIKIIGIMCSIGTAAAIWQGIKDFKEGNSPNEWSPASYGSASRSLF